MPERTTERAPDVEPARAPSGPKPATPESTTPLLNLQRTAGNAAVVAMLASPAEAATPVIQPKLEVGAVNDPAELEADAIAEQVLGNLQRTAASAAPDDNDDDGGGDAPAARSAVRRFASRIRRSPDASDSPGHGAGGGAVDAGVAKQIDSARGGGRPMDPGTQTRMESGFGADFSGVRIHDGPKAENLNRSLNAQAFTTGSDIFVGRKGMDDHVLAHELAHTVQQGASKPVRRFVSTAQFLADTNEGTFTAKGTAQKKIEKYLNEFYALTGKKQDVDIVKAPAAAIPKGKLRAGLQLLKLMKLTCEGWLATHKGADGGIQEDRKKRGAGITKFLETVNGEIVAFENALQTVAGNEEDKGAIADTKFDARAEKIKQKFSGNLTEGFSLAEKAIGALTTNDGDSTDFMLDINVPLGGPGYLSVTLNFNVRKQGNVDLGLNVLVGAGAKFPGVADLRGALGGYIKASGKDAKSAVTLAKYGIYRRLRESKAVPRGMANLAWGGTTGDDGYAKGEEWSKQVEKKHLEEEGAFVETGGMAEGSAKLGSEDALGLGVTASYQSGTRHDKTSVEAAKGSLGADNTRANGDASTPLAKGRGAQAKTGRDVQNIRLAGIVAGGPWSGELVLAWSYRYDPNTKKMAQSSIEVQFNLKASMAVADLTSTIVSSIAAFTSTAKSKYQSLSREAEDRAKKTGPKDPLQPLKTAAGFLVPAALTGNNIANAVAFDKAGVPWTQWASGVTKESSAEQVKQGAKQLLSKVGLEIGFFVRADDAKQAIDGLIELRHVTSMDAALPQIVKAKLVSKKRLGAAKYNGTDWDVIM